MKAYSKMMDAVWNLNALATGFQTSRILCKDILERKEEYQACLGSEELDDGAKVFWQDSVKSILSEVDAYGRQLREISEFLNDLTGGMQK